MSTLWLALWLILLGACASRPSVLRAPAASAAGGQVTSPPPPVLAPPVAASGPSTAASTPNTTAAPVDLPPAAPAAASAPAAVVDAPDSPAVAARFPEPAADFRTPAFDAGRSDYTSNAELAALLRRLVRDGGPGPGATTVRLLVPGTSQSGVPIEALHFTRDPDPGAALPVRAPRPTVLFVGQQHGDEPAGAEALLVLAQQLAQGPLQRLLDRVDVVVLPRANPDGAAAGTRLTANGIDLNRDHLLLKTPEAQTQAQLVRQFAPLVVVDAHEYTVGGRYLQKFGAVQRFDALLQYAMTANLPEFVTKASEEWFRRPLVARLKAAGLTSEWYYTTSSDSGDLKLSMGGAQPDTGRNVNGLKNAVSVLIETRGVGIGRQHLKRRVFTQLTALTSVLESAASRAADLTRLRLFVDAEVGAKACQGDAVVEAETTASEYELTMLDPTTGADRIVAVAWDSALRLMPRKVRPRPCGYWLSNEQGDAVARLRALGVLVQRIEEVGVVRGQAYRETAARQVAPRADVRGTIADADGVVKVAVETLPMLVDVQPGSYYVGLDQPLANLVVAALEPDTQSSYLAHRIIASLAGQARVMLRPELRMTPVP